MTFPTIVLTIAMILELTVFAFFVTHVIRSQKYVEVTSESSMRIEELRGTIMRLDEVLTMSARMAAATGDLKWEERYNVYVPQLDAALKESQELVPTKISGKTAQLTDEANKRLIEMETKAFELVRGGKKDQAQRVLFSPEYESQKKIYASGMDAYNKQVRQMLASVHQEERARANSSLMITGVGLLILITAWISVLYSLRRWKSALVENSLEREKAEQSLRQVLSGARCLLWQAEVEETSFGLRCEISIQEEDAAWSWLHLPSSGERSYVDALSLARGEANGATFEDTVMEAVRSGKENFVHRFSCRQSDGKVRWLYEDISIIQTEPQAWRVIGACTDVTDLKVAEEQLEHQAYHDSLTGLPNRQLFMDRLASAIKRTRGNQKSVGVMFIDFDNFKVIKDSLGHEAGDQFLLSRVASIKECIRPGDTLARLGGDEFVILLEGLPEGTEMIPSHVAARILAQFEEPVKMMGQDIYSGVSIGIALSNAESNSVSLLRDADTAMYQVKTEGKSNFACFHEGMNDRVNEQLEMECGLRAAISRNEIAVHYQPLIDLETGQMIGSEALARWTHPTKGPIAPCKFIPIAEETGLIIPLGYWVLEEACRQTVEWQVSHPNDVPLIISVNLSGRQLQRGDVVERITEILGRTKLPPQCLKLEITESVMMKDMEETVMRLRELKSFGIQLAIDDFGTGYSSLASLAQFPIDTIKIDRSFVARLGKYADAEATIAALVALGQALNMDVTSEGVESIEQLTQLQELGCTLGQGYLFARPMSGADMTAQMEKSFGEICGVLPDLDLDERKAS